MIAGALSLTLLGSAQADYGKPAPSERTRSSEEDGFESLMDLNRVRKGNFEWDTQQLIANGFLALHRENQKILRELEALKSEVQKLEEGKK